MKCTKCGLNEATTEVLQRHNDHIEKMYLCDECAKDFRPDMNFDDFDMLNKIINGSPMGLLSNLNSFFDTPTARAMICPDCKTTSEEFLKTGYVGCPRCYEVFEPLIVQTVKKLQQSDRHIGKCPTGKIGGANGDERSRLKAELQNAIDVGDYKRASIISGKLGKLDGNGEDF